MEIQLETGDKVRVKTPTAAFEIEAGSWYDGELKSPDTYTRADIYSSENRKYVFDKRVPLSSVPGEVDKGHMEVWVRRETDVENWKRAPEDKKVKRLVERITKMRDEAREEKRKYGVKTKNYTACESAYNALDAVLLLIEEGRI